MWKSLRCLDLEVDDFLAVLRVADKDMDPSSERKHADLVSGKSISLYPLRKDTGREGDPIADRQVNYNYGHEQVAGTTSPFTTIILYLPFVMAVAGVHLPRMLLKKRGTNKRKFVS